MHKTVLLKEAVEVLNIEEGDVIVDATLGAGGHALEIAKRVGDRGKVLAFDMDIDAISEFDNKIQKEHPQLKDRFKLINENFADLEGYLRRMGIEKVDGILADLGWRIEQVQNEKYGMSFLKDSRLDMRMDQSEDKESAFDIINNWDEKDLSELFRDFGEEKKSKPIARLIVQERKAGPIKTTKELADLIERVSRRKGKIHPATRAFQSLRIKVNSEFENIDKLLSCSAKNLRSGGRIAIITFHSLEDRIVKKFFQANARGCVCPKEFPVCVCGEKGDFEIVTKKPIIASKLEIEENPRSRSAKLRVAEKIGTEN